MAMAAIDPSRIQGLRMATTLKREGESQPGQPVEYKTSNGGTVKTTDEFVQRFADFVGSEFPGTLSWADVVAHMGQGSERQLSELVIKFYMSNLLSLRRVPDAFQVIASERPIASPIARLYASRFPKHSDRFAMPNLRHEMVSVDSVCARLMPAIDGSRNYQDFLNYVDEWPDNIMERSPAEVRKIVDRVLQKLGEQALLLRA
jgi:hypothetical protein